MFRGHIIPAGEDQDQIADGDLTEQSVCFLRVVGLMDVGRRSGCVVLSGIPALQTSEERFVYSPGFLSRPFHPDLVELPEQIGVGVVANNNVHYARPEDYRAHDILRCIAEKTPIQQIHPDLPLNDERYLKWEPFYCAEQRKNLKKTP